MYAIILKKSNSTAVERKLKITFPTPEITDNRHFLCIQKNRWEREWFKVLCPFMEPFLGMRSSKIKDM